MRRALLIGLPILVLASVGAFLAGRAARPQPPAPDSKAAQIDVARIQASRWSLAEARVPAMVTPQPTPTAVPTSAPVVPTAAPTTSDFDTAPIDPSPPVVTDPAPDTGGGGTGGGGTGGGSITGDTE